MASGIRYTKGRQEPQFIFVVRHCKMIIIIICSRLILYVISNCTNMCHLSIHSTYFIIYLLYNYISTYENTYRRCVSNVSPTACRSFWAPELILGVEGTRAPFRSSRILHEFFMSSSSYLKDLFSPEEDLRKTQWKNSEFAVTFNGDKDVPALALL